MTAPCAAAPVPILPAPRPTPRSLSLDNLLLILTAALLERQLVFFCPHISVLSACVLGLLPLLRPFAWQSLLMPVTPASMMVFLDAPVPFVLGVQYKTSDVMARCEQRTPPFTCTTKGPQ